jgi:hypothetical protein
MEQITTDPTGGKKADMERPTKPVMWTDEEGVSRLVKWIDVNTKRLLEKYYTWNSLIEMVVFDNKITIDSLLHDLNIIKPIGRLEYESKWIDKILSGQKTMDILPVQHTCGYYELWDTERQEVRGGVDVTQVQKILFEDNNILGLLSMRSFPYIQMSKNTYKFCGFDSREAFADHHRTHFQSVKYAITYRVVDMKGDWE